MTVEGKTSNIIDKTKNKLDDGKSSLVVLIIDGKEVLALNTEVPKQEKEQK